MMESYLVMTETNSSSTRESGPRVWVLSSAASSISSEKIFLGNREILTEVGAGDIFDEVYAVLADEYQSIAVVAVQPTEAAFFSIDKMLTTCSSNCTFHNIIIKNMLRVMAQKNLMLTRKMAHLSRKSIREKLVSYLSDESSRQGKREIKIPFNRQQLADYLSVERSALSRELSKMKEEGLIEFYKNQFVLYHVT